MQPGADADFAGKEIAMWLTEEEIDTVYKDLPLKRRPTSMHASAAPGATRQQVLNELRASQLRVLEGGFDVIKSMDDGTTSFRRNYKGFREIGWNPIKSFIVALTRKIKNIWQIWKV